nr:hypothetical protein [Tanacetum cinerariifolium]
VVKHTGDVTRLQALVDKKKIEISEDAIREILRLDDAEGVFCLLNDEIFTGLAQMGYEKPVGKRCSGVETPLFENMLQVREVDAEEEVQVFANMRRVGKGCSGIETPLFDNMLQVREENAVEEVQVPTHDDVDQENVVEETADDVAQPTSPLPPSPIVPPSPPHQSPRTSPSQAAKGTSILVQQVLDKYFALVHRVKGLESANTAQQLEILKLKARVKKDEENVFNQGRKSVDIEEGIEIVDDQQKDEDSEVQEVVKVVNAAKLITEVVTAATTQVIPAAEPVVAAVSTPISTAKPKGLKAVHAAPTVSTRKRKGVVIRDPKEELHDDTLAET